METKSKNHVLLLNKDNYNYVMGIVKLSTLNFSKTIWRIIEVKELNWCDVSETGSAVLKVLPLS